MYSPLEIRYNNNRGDTMKYKKISTYSYNLHIIKTDKFKTVRMEIIFSREVEKEKMPIFTFLCDILTDSSKEYQRRKDIG